MRILNRPLTLRHLLLVAVAALTLGVGATAVAVSSKGGPEEAGKVNLGTKGGYNYRLKTISSGPGTGQDFVSVRCPNSRNLTGGGAYSSATFGQENLNSSYPFDDDDSGSEPDDGWGAWFDNYGGGTYTITAFAICK